MLLVHTRRAHPISLSLKSAIVDHENSSLYEREELLESIKKSYCIRVRHCRISPGYSSRARLLAILPSPSNSIARYRRSSSFTTRFQESSLVSVMWHLDHTSSISEDSSSRLIVSNHTEEEAQDVELTKSRDARFVAAQGHPSAAKSLHTKRFSSRGTCSGGMIVNKFKHSSSAQANCLSTAPRRIATS